MTKDEIVDAMIAALTIVSFEIDILFFHF